MLPSQRAPAATQTIGRGPSAGRCNHSPTDHHHVCGLRTTACEHMEQVCAGARAAHAHGMFALGLATGILITAAWVKLSISD